VLVREDSEIVREEEVWDSDESEVVLPIGGTITPPDELDSAEVELLVVGREVGGNVVGWGVREEEDEDPIGGTVTCPELDVLVEPGGWLVVLLPPPPEVVGLCDVLDCWVREVEEPCETLVEPEVAGPLVVPPVEDELEGPDVVPEPSPEEELVEGICEVDEGLETELCVELKDVEIEVDVGSRLVLIELGRLLEDGIEDELVGRVVICVVVACLWDDAKSISLV